MSFLAFHGTHTALTVCVHSLIFPCWMVTVLLFFSFKANSQTVCFYCMTVNLQFVERTQETISEQVT